MLKYSIIGIFCEDVRVERNSQNTIIGILPDNVTVQSFPGSFPKICVYIRAHFDLEFHLKSLVYELVRPDGVAFHSIIAEKNVIEETYSLAKNNGHPYAGLISVAIISPFQVEMPGHYTIRAKVNEEPIACGTLNVKLSPSPA